MSLPPTGIMKSVLDVLAFTKMNEYPEIGSKEFEELTRLLDVMETKFRNAGIIPRVGKWPPKDYEISQ